jgi:hypothetical protein
VVEVSKPPAAAKMTMKASHPPQAQAVFCVRAFFWYDSV